MAGENAPPCFLCGHSAPQLGNFGGAWHNLYISWLALPWLCIENSIRRAFTSYFQLFLREIPNWRIWEGTPANLSLTQTPLRSCLNLQTLCALSRVKLCSKMGSSGIPRRERQVSLGSGLVWTGQEARLGDKPVPKGQKANKDHYEKLPFHFRTRSPISQFILWLYSAILPPFFLYFTYRYSISKGFAMHKLPCKCCALPFYFYSLRRIPSHPSFRQCAFRLK